MLKIGNPDIVRLSLPSRLNLLGVLQNVANVLCERLSFDEDTCLQVSLAVVEAGTNAIHHGHGRDPDKLVEVEFRSWPDRIEITVHDGGRGFDLSGVDTDITSEEARFLAGKGRGIFIMRSCMDTVDFRFDATGTTCHLVKHRPAVSAATG